MDKTPCSSFTEEANNGDSYGKNVLIKRTQLFNSIWFNNPDFKEINGILGKSMKQCPLKITPP